MAASLTGAKKFMRVAGEEAYSKAAAVHDSPYDQRECTVSSDALTLRRIVAASIDTDLGKCSIILFLIWCATRVINVRILAVNLAQMSMKILG